MVPKRAMYRGFPETGHRREMDPRINVCRRVRGGGFATNMLFARLQLNNIHLNALL